MEDRLKLKLDKLLEDGKAYESEQLAITLFTRLKKMNKVEDAEGVLVSTSIKLLQMKDAGTGTALSVYYLDHLKKEKVEADKSVLESIAQLSSQIEGDKELDDFSDHVAKYATAIESKEVRKVVVERYLKLKRFGKAYLHVLKVNEAECLAQVLMEWALDEATLKEERDLIIARGELECLALGQLETCDRCFIICAKKWRAVPYEPTPLLNCVAFVLKVLRRKEDGANMLLELRALYADSLDRDPMFDTFLAHCHKRYFAQSTRQGGGGGGGDLMSMISGMFNTN